MAIIFSSIFHSSRKWSVDIENEQFVLKIFQKFLPLIFSRSIFLKDESLPERN